MTLDQLRYFLETARFEHLGKAARSASISPSAVSHAIAALERELQLPLFLRQGKTLRITPAGRALQLRAETILRQISRIPAELTGQRPGLSGTYRLAASHLLAARLLAPTWAKIAIRHPDATAELSSMRTSQVLVQILGGELDAGIVLSPLPHPKLFYRRLGQGSLCLAVREGHPALKQGWSALRHYPAVHFKASGGVEPCETHPALIRHRLDRSVAVTFDSDDLAISFLENSDAWALLPEPLVRPHSPYACVGTSRNRLTPLRSVMPPPGFRASYEIVLAARAGRELEPLFIELAEFAELGDWGKRAPKIQRH